MFFFCTGLHGKLPNIVLPPEFANLCCTAQIKEENKATCDAQGKRKKRYICGLSQASKLLLAPKGQNTLVPYHKFQPNRFMLYETFLLPNGR